MKNSFLIFLSLGLCCMLGSCICDDEPACCSPAKVTVEMTVRPDPMTVVTRTTDETAIRDVNLFLCSPEGLQHLYSTASHLHIECVPGAYTLYVIANAHADLQDLTVTDLERYAIDHRSDYDDLPMTARIPVTIPTTIETVRLPVIEVTRAVARIDYDITVDEAVSDIVIQSVLAMNLPKQYRPFDEDDLPLGFTDTVAVENIGYAATVKGSFYMLPNCRGTRPPIASPEQKNPANAPEDATCLHIRALRSGKVLDYYVYLGENDTSDFNVRANTVHTLRIRILGDSDLRLRQYAVDVSMTTRSQPQDGFMTEHLDGLLNVQLSGHYDDMEVRGVLSLQAGDAARCRFDAMTPHVPLNFDLSSGSLDCPAVYRPEIFTRDNMRLHFTLTLFDKYGEVGQYDFEYTFAYFFQVYRIWQDGPRSLHGRIVSEDALKIVEHETLTAIYDAVYCTAEGCTLKAEPNDGYAVDCWCSHPGHMGELSYEPIYRVVPASGQSAAIVYLFFVPTGSQLETTFILDRTEVSAYERTILDFAVEQSGYTGTYTVKVEGVPTFFRELYMDQRPVTEFTIPGNGSYRLRMRPEAVGDNPFTVTITDEHGNGRNFRSSLTGIKTISYFSFDFSKAPGLGIDVIAECTDPVSEKLELTVKPTVRIVGRTGATTSRTYETAVSMEAGTMRGRGTLILDLSPGDTFSVTDYDVAFSRRTSNNGMIEYIPADLSISSQS